MQRFSAPADTGPKPDRAELQLTSNLFNVIAHEKHGVTYDSATRAAEENCMDHYLTEPIRKQNLTVCSQEGSLNEGMLPSVCTFVPTHTHTTMYL